MKRNHVYIIEWQTTNGKWLPDNCQHFTRRKDSKYFSGAESMLKDYRARNPKVKLRIRKYEQSGGD